MDEKELAAELQASKHDPDEWGDADVGATDQKKRLSAMVSVRLAKEELEYVQAKARERGRSVSAYLREVALQDMSEQSQPERYVPFGVFISTGGTYSTHMDTPSFLSDGRRLATTSG